MSGLNNRLGRDVNSRHVRRAVLEMACGLEVLETRALMSAMTGHAAAVVAAAHENHGAVEAAMHHAPTPIANFTGNPLTFSEIVGLPAVQNSALPAVQNSLLPAVQDIATITSSTVPPKLNGYTVSIDWGDGTAATRGALVKGKGGLIHVKGFHSFAAPGTFSVTITVTQNKPKPAAGATVPTLVIVSTANVTQNSAGGVTITPTAGTALSGVVGNFTLPTGDTMTAATTFKAFISWGDRHFSQGTVTLNTDGTYSVSGDHTYARAGSFRISIFVVQVVPRVTSATAATRSGEAGEFKGHVKQDFRRVRFIATIFSTATVGAAGATV